MTSSRSDNADTSLGRGSGANPEFVGASRISVEQLMTPRPAPDGFEFRSGTVYGTAGAGGRPLTLSLYAASPGERRPGVLFIHGGGFGSGHPFMMVHHARELAGAGYVTATMEYRLFQEELWPAALEDVKCAVRWLRAHADEVGLHPEKIAVAGGSAGGHLAALAGLTPGRFEGTGGWSTTPSHVQAAILYNPLLDMRGPGTELTRSVTVSFLGSADPDLLTEASPITHVSSECPPVLTLVGDEDAITPVSVCREFHRVLGKSGVTNRLEVIPGKGHGLPMNSPERCVESTLAFLRGGLPVGV